MARRKRIYYPKGAIRKGLYTAGLEWMTVDGTEYIGQYHSYINTGEVYTLSNFVKDKSVKLVPYADLTNQAIKRTFSYNVLKEKVDDYEPVVKTPDPFYPIPTNEDYEKGYFDRYFLKRKGNKYVFEVSEDGFSFDDPYFKKLKIRWKISGPLNDTAAESGIIDTNRRTILKVINEMEGIDLVLNNLQQYAKL